MNRIKMLAATVLGWTAEDDAASSTSEDLDLEKKASTPPLGRRLMRFLILQLVVFAVLGIGGLLLAVSGVMPVNASSGHWAITEWFLHFAMQRSVSTHSIGIEVPPLDDRALVIRGAGHFEGGCKPCHGSPDLSLPVVPHAMTPHPPRLEHAANDWAAQELFYIVKHGVKFTGMPAWPAQTRDDEVWALTAFLLELPNLDASSYRQLVGGISENVENGGPLAELAFSEEHRAVQMCARCHGVRGESRGAGAFPILAAQSQAYIEDAMQAYAKGQRNSGIMQPIAAGLSARETKTLATYYSEQDRVDATMPADAASLERGERIARVGVPSQGVPACMQCHGPADHDLHPHYPRLAGQYRSYLKLQLELFKSGSRGGSEYAHLMRPVANGLTAEQMADVAAFYASRSSE